MCPSCDKRDSEATPKAGGFWFLDSKQLQVLKVGKNDQVGGGGESFHPFNEGRVDGAGRNEELEGQTETAHPQRANSSRTGRREREELRARREWMDGKPGGEPQKTGVYLATFVPVKGSRAIGRRSRESHGTDA